MPEDKENIQSRQATDDGSYVETQASQTNAPSVHADQRAVAVGGSLNNSIVFTGDINVEAEAIQAPYSLLPPQPTLLIGRTEDLTALKSLINFTSDLTKSETLRRLTVVRGWVGVGKTTMVTALAHDPEVSSVFPDGVLWASLGQAPNILAELVTWGRALGIKGITHARDIREASLQLSAFLRDRRMLLLVDDVWELAHAEAFKVGGSGCAMLFTTRSDTIAQTLAADPEGVYRLDVLSPDFAYDLLSKLAPDVFVARPDECRELVEELGRLPLAIQVAGKLLHVESRFGWGVDELLSALRSGKKLLEAQAPADRADLVLGTTPSVVVLLEKSTERLEPEVRDRFALLGVFAPEPWSFDLDALKAMWLTEEPKGTVRELVSRGLLEPVGERGRFQLHALLALHARSMLTE